MAGADVHTSVESVQRYTAIFSFFRSLHTSPLAPYPALPSILPSPTRAALVRPTQGTALYFVRGKKKKSRPSWMYDPPEREEFHSTPQRDPRPPPEETDKSQDELEIEEESTPIINLPPPAPPPPASTSSAPPSPQAPSAASSTPPQPSAPSNAVSQPTQTNPAFVSGAQSLFPPRPSTAPQPPASTSPTSSPPSAPSTSSTAEQPTAPPSWSSSSAARPSAPDQQTSPSSTSSPPPPSVTPGPEQTPSPGETSPPPPQGEPAYLRFYPRHLRQLARSLPHIHLRPPSIEDILKVTTGFWQRLSVRFRWLTIRSFRRFTAEEYGTFLGWFVLSQTVWLLVGTTTFVGAIVLTLNSLQLQHYVARMIGDYLTAETGWDITYESATVPRWTDATISFKNVYVSQKPTTTTTTKEDGTTEERAWYMTVNLDIDSIDVTLSLWRWLDGKGLVKNAVIKGVRGIMDRRNVYWDPDKVYNPADYRHSDSPGSFELESLRIEDALVTVYQTRRFRPFFVSIYKAEIGRFRRQWMFYDFIYAESIVGQFDNCLFSVHKPQSVSRTRDAAMKDEGWKRLSRLRIDGVNIDHLKATLSSEGGLWSWIQSGKVDAVLDIRFPSHPDDDNLDLSQIISNITAELADQLDRIPGQRELARPALEVPGDMEESELAISEDLQGDTKQRKVEIDIDLRFRDLKAAVPIWTSELSYVNNALIRPIVAFINANRTLLPIRCRIVKDLSDFDGSWTIWETGLMDDIAAKTYDALAYHVQHGMNRNIKAVSLWSLQMTANAVLAALRNALDHAGEGMLNMQSLQALHAFAI
ncbi:hypothetical protein CALVIDRAFT_499882 [Calocera viscosa TUFC12733]|uniref:Mitochondrial distribution and morphology protein family 31/32 n=1 Tax=Calocera viscosa (strain TUFC12733) TaxID=1330018 RepID=A0A167LCW8_CALVF|nr:hypothetical protein CALVIDRAFT_499882 [Calocera viscosa TUFC12733]